MKHLRMVKDLLKRNFKTLVLFELFYKTVILSLAPSLFVRLFRLSMTFSGVSYLSSGNFITFLHHPMTLCILILLLFLIASCTLLEMCSLLYLFESSRCNIKVSVFDLLSQGYHHAKRIFSKKNWSLLFYVLFLIPITNVTFSSSILNTMKIPDYLLDGLFVNRMLSFFFLFLYFLLFLLSFYWIYSIPIFVFQKKDFVCARNESRSLFSKNKSMVIRTILIGHFLLWICYNAFLYLLLAIFSVGANLYFQHQFIFSFLLSVPMVLYLLLFLVHFVCYVPFITALNVSNYYIVSGMKLKNTLAKDKRGKKKGKKRILLAFFLSILFGTVSMYFYFTRPIKTNLFYPIEIMAHRGDSSHHLENTLPAFLDAIDSGADFIELDVLLTKDKKVVVFHDKTLKRLGNLSNKIEDMTYQELQAISLKDSEEKIPLLEDVLKVCKGKIKVNIELKKISDMSTLVEKVLNIISKEEMEGEVVLSSFSLEGILLAKKENPNLKVGYILSFYYGDLSEYPLDFVSMEKSILTKENVLKLHEEGLKVYAWTVNKQEDLLRMMELGVDGVITDVPLESREILYSQDKKSLFLYYLEKLSK